MVTIEVEGRRKKASEAFVEIAQQLWRHPIEHTDDSPQIPPYPLGQIRQKEAISKPRIAQKVMATRGAKKRNVATKGNRTNYSTLVATKETEKQNVLKLRDGCGDANCAEGCGDQGARKKTTCAEIVLKGAAIQGGGKRHVLKLRNRWRRHRK